jgi:hypothetical protein
MIASLTHNKAARPIVEQIDDFMIPNVSALKVIRTPNAMRERETSGLSRVFRSQYVRCFDFCLLAAKGIRCNTMRRCETRKRDSRRRGPYFFALSLSFVRSFFFFFLLPFRTERERVGVLATGAQTVKVLVLKYSY